MLHLKIDLVSAIKRQLGFDDEKKKREEAKQRADPQVAARISQYRQKYPHLTAGIMLSAAKAGYEVDDPRLDKLGELTAKRKLAKGAGWYSPGDIPKLKDDKRIWFDAVFEAADQDKRDQGSIIQSYKPLIRATAAIGQTGGEVLGAIARGVAGAIQDKDISKLVSPLTEEKYTAVQAGRGILSGKGAGLGQGFFPDPEAPAQAAQRETAQNTYSLTYSDKPIFRAPGAESPAPAPHAGTLGRILMKDISEPGSFWFQAGSGIIDAAAALFLDPAAKASKIAGERNAAAKVFTAEEAGRTGKAVAGASEETVRIYRGGKVLAEDATTKAERTSKSEMYSEFLKAPISDAEKLAYQGKIDSLSEQGRWWTSDPEYAKEFAGKGEGVQFLDVPKSVADEALKAAKARNSKFGKVKKADEFLLPEEYRGQGSPFDNSTALTPFTEANEDATLKGLTHAQITEELSRRAGLINGRRQSVHGPTFTNWLTTDATGRKFAKWTSDNNDAYTIWKTLGGEEGKFPTLLAKQMADAKTPEEAVQVLSPQLGTGLRLKPSVNSFSPVGGMFEGVGIKNSARSVRLLQTLPHGAIDFTDVDETATQLVRHMRNAKRSEADIGAFFDELASTTDPLQRKTLLRIMDYSNAQHIVETELTRLDVQHSTPALNRNFARLRSMYGQDDEILQEINRLHASRGTVVRNVLIDGELSNPLRSHFEELEDSSQLYRPANPREVRRITSTYGRLLNHPTLDLPVAVLDHINNLLKGMAILRPALAPRVIGEEHARMAVAGYDTMFNHPLSYIAFLTGRKGSSDVFGEEFNAMRELTPFRKALAKQADLHTNLTAEHTAVLPFTDKRFVKAWARDIQDLIDDPVTSRLSGRWGPDDLGIKAYHGTNKEFEVFELRPSNYEGQGEAVFFTNNPEAADRYSKMMTGGKPTIKTAHLNPRRMATLSAEEGSFIPQAKIDELRAAGYDSFKYVGKSGDVSYGVIEPSIISSGPGITGDNLADTKRWLASSHPEAVEYRSANPHITPDSLDAYVDNANDTFISKTFNNESLKEAVRTGAHAGEPILTAGEKGPRFSRSFQAHLRALTDADKGPDLTIGEFALPATVESVTTAYRRTTDYLFSHLLTNPSNKYNRSQTFRQQYWKSAGDELIIHAAPDTQKALIQSARDNNMGEDFIKALRAKAKTASGDLTLDEVDLFAKARALEAVKSLLYDLSDRNQFMDIMRLIFPFGEAWKEGITAWSHLSRARPQIIPRALMVVNGIQDSGFFYTDPVSGEEMFAWPGGHVAMNALTGIPTPVQSQVQSLNMITGGGNPLMPGFGAIPQELVRNFLPNLPKWDGVRDLVAPYSPRDPSNLYNFLPSWAQHLRDYIGSPANEVNFANTRSDVMRYLYSTGKYDLNNSASLAQFEAEATKIARSMSLIRSLAVAVLPAAPSYQDVAVDKEGHTTLAFAMTEEYRKLLDLDRTNNTNLAVTTFIDKFGENNLLYMQSATKGGDVFSKSGYDWVRENQDIAKSYPGVYSFFAPSDGGLDMKAYHALFENGERKPLSPREFLEAAQNRVAKMAYRNAQDKLPDPNKRTKAQKQWLRDVKAQLLSDFPGFVPEFQGSDIPKTIRELSDAVTNPKLAKNPQAQAISEYLEARQKVIDQALARKTPIDGWQTAKAMKSSRDWLRDIASDITSRYPSFKNINRELFDQELAEDD